MKGSSTAAGRTRWFLVRETRTRTSWPFRVALLATLAAGVWLTRDAWRSAVALSLVCAEGTTPSDALLLENFDPDYLVFERARQLRRADVAQRVLVPTAVDPGTDEPNDVSLGTVELMARISRLGPHEIVPLQTAIEPISLNAAYGIRDFLEREGIRSVTVVSPLFRSRRSALVYGATLGPAGIAVRCVPAPAAQRLDEKSQRWHGLQNLVEQWGKLQYYRFYVLPFRTKG